MKTQQTAITPEQAELSLAVLSGPRGSVQDDWSCIEYTVQLSRRRQVVWTGEYRLGIGHVKSNPRPFDMPQERRAIADKLGAPGKWLVPLIQVADVAAELAKRQKVTPRLNDVTHSLLSDGSAFFDGLRFKEWCADLGYDADSRKAEGIYRACDEIGRSLARHLSRDELAGLREWASSY